MRRTCPTQELHPLHLFGGSTDEFKAASSKVAPAQEDFQELFNSCPTREIENQNFNSRDTISPKTVPSCGADVCFGAQAKAQGGGYRLSLLGWRPSLAQTMSPSQSACPMSLEVAAAKTTDDGQRARRFCLHLALLTEIKARSATFSSSHWLGHFGPHPAPAQREGSGGGLGGEANPKAVL